MEFTVWNGCFDEDEKFEATDIFINENCPKEMVE